MEIPKRARSWKRRLRPRANLKNDMPVLYSTDGRPEYFEKLVELGKSEATGKRALLCHGVSDCRDASSLSSPSEFLSP